MPAENSSESADLRNINRAEVFQGYLCVRARKNLIYQSAKGWHPQFDTCKGICCQTDMLVLACKALGNELIDQEPDEVLVP